MIITLTLKRVNKSEVISDAGAPRISCFEIDVAMSKMGITMGNPRIAMRVALFSVLDANDETIVNADASPILPTKRLTKNQALRFPGDPSKSEKMTIDIRINTNW
tara:strand:- start:63 stop:377 length:315 start_codon:yes stop_codon:yes gene_type:complete